MWPHWPGPHCISVETPVTAALSYKELSRTHTHAREVMKDRETQKRSVLHALVAFRLALLSAYVRVFLLFQQRRRDTIGRVLHLSF